MAVNGTFDGFVIRASEEREFDGEYGREIKWTTAIADKPDAQYGELVEVADRKLKDLIDASVGKRVRVTARPVALTGGKRGAWLKLAASKIEVLPV